MVATLQVGSSYCCCFTALSHRAAQRTFPAQTDKNARNRVTQYVSQRVLPTKPACPAQNVHWYSIKNAWLSHNVICSSWHLRISSRKNGSVSGETWPPIKLLIFRAKQTRAEGPSLRSEFTPKKIMLRRNQWTAQKIKVLDWFLQFHQFGALSYIHI